MIKTNFKHILSAFAVAGFLFIAFGSGDEKKTETEIVNGSGDEKKTETEIVNESPAVEIPAVEISASQLYKDYESNGVAADQKYKGKVLRVSGVVSNIDRDIMDKIYVTLKGDQYFGDIQCFFAEDHVNTAAQLSKGQRITVKGKCDGKLMNVMLKGCIIE